MSKRLLAVVCLCLVLMVGCTAPVGESEPVIHAPVWEARFTDSVKILAIGNSYTQNAITFLYPILEDMGIGEIVVANLFIGGCDLTRHVENANNDVAAYTYYKTVDGTMTKREGATLKDGLLDEDWDIIVLNQASQKAGQDMTYLKLDDLCAYVNENKTNSEAELWWHMTWAYHPNNPHEGFRYYNNSQKQMYEKIAQTVQGTVVPLDEITGVIPSGTAFQNVRAQLGNCLSDTDLHHANAAGCYLLGLTWASALTGTDPQTVDWLPEGLSAEELSVFQNGVTNAVAAPYAVTE